MKRLLFTLFFCVPLIGNSAQISFVLDNPSLKELISEIETQSDFKFAYGSEIQIQTKLYGRYSFQDEDLKKILTTLSTKTHFSFEVLGNNIAITVDPPVKNIGIEKTKPQMNIEGNVTDSNGTPLPSVTVQEEGTNNGVMTDFDGNYSIEVSSSESVLVFSYIGMETAERTVGDNTTINVQMEDDSQALDEVVVVGYGTQRRSDITGAVGVVSSEEFEDEPVVQVGQALQGKVAGLQVSQNSGSPGSGLLIRVRGTGTVNNSEPLYVVDGNPNANPIDLIPEQIESIQVLKSASAAAIYGAQGANGVILITTKQGKSGKPTLNINFSQGWQEIQRHIPMTNAMEYATLYNEALINAGEDPIYPDPSALGEGTDWQEEVFQVAPMTNLSVSTSGGGESSSYFFSAGYSDQEGIVKGSGFDRLNLRVNTSMDITPAITIGENLSASLSNFENISQFNFGSILGSTLTANPEIPARFPDGSWGFSETSLNSTNPAANIHYSNNDTKRTVINGNVYTDISFLQDFVFRSQFNFNLGFTENVIFNPEYSISPRTFNAVANLTENFSRFTEYSWANTLTYNKSFEDHTFEALAGYTMQEAYSKNVSAYGAGLPANATDNENLRYLDLNTQSNSVGGSAGSYGILSYLGRVNYNYARRYFVTANFRADGSSRFGVNNKWGNFPSFSLGWKLSEENFLQNTEWITNLMLRGGWGSLGNQGSLPNYAFANLVEPNNNYVFGYPQEVYRGQAPTGLGNPDLKWESTQETNIGLDFSGFEGKLRGSLDWYNRETTDMLLQVPIAGYAGIEDSPYVNGGSVVNKGYEAMLSYENTTQGGLAYSLSGNIAHNSNEVTSLSNAGSSLYQFISFVGLVNVTQVGSPIASFWGWQTDGIFQTPEEVEMHAFQSNGTAPGDIRFKDINGDNIINAEDQTIIGDPWPSFTYGMNGSLSYSNFDFSVALQGVSGNEIFSAYKFRTEGPNFFNYTQNVFDNRWTGPGTSNDVPRLNSDDPNNNFRSSEYYLEDGSYLRIRNIQLSYRLPEEVFENLRLSIYGSVQNAFTFTSYSGFDPEIGTNGSNSLYVGIDETNYPVPRIYTLGLKMSL
ncbi:SusC/RagA family TonB-linked outer membrane protein [Autumnicola psychrophila]|uniref:TonB-dependent receptor n=1 Tax=Autumnicola psychrophila TaxID=3075592 RepID=A0ABU3DMP7_9FLAO|nr:TonB-dependent receptor [Zunongwangia sp. F225]MDT0684994.1 TonB-dependent receptor [Zunongwangia sp. F225]